MRLSRVAILAIFFQGYLFCGSDLSIDEQIQKIREAPPSQRYILVNELKKQIAQMNALEQARAIEQYQEESIKAQHQVGPTSPSPQGNIEIFTSPQPGIAQEANSQNLNNQILHEQEHNVIVPPIKDIQNDIKDHQEELEQNLPQKASPDIDKETPIKTPSVPSDEIQKDIQNPKDLIPTPSDDSDESEFMPDLEDSKPDFNLPTSGDEEDNNPDFNPSDKSPQENRPDISGGNENDSLDNVPKFDNPPSQNQNKQDDQQQIDIPQDSQDGANFTKNTPSNTPSPSKSFHKGGF